VTNPAPADVQLRKLMAVKALHTLAWAVFAGCIIAIPFASWRGEHAVAAWLAALVFGEIVVLALNAWSCPLTAVAARYTSDRRANFDICLPEWLARYNKQIFGPLYLGAVAFAAVCWMLSTA
jgi:hypothetical protein